jgi:predicted metal-dependent HD superfamily phosphohydrolase
MNAQTRTQGLERERFLREWGSLGASHDNAFDILDAMYAEPHRAYHNAEHVAECLAWLDQTWDLAERPSEIAIAIFFHDAIYAPGAPDNEARSAELFERLARQAQVPVDVTGRVVALIESTAAHAEAEGDGALLNDIDLGILGAPRERYARYEQDVRAEFGAVLEGLYRAGRARFLRELLGRSQIYRTPRLAALLEKQARSNLAWALAKLKE